MPQPPVTRFAPSPTGYLHIGGARTALFNWLYARSKGGKFLLRIEDTDRARHNEAAVEAILDGLSWLGIDWDEDPVSQYGNRERHVEIANKLLHDGNAYRCYLTPEETEARRNKAQENNQRFVSPWRESTEAPPDQPCTIRFRAPIEGETVIEDAVQGTVKFPNSALDDLIILRSNCEPTYNLAVVADDHDMGVTHIIRGDDHLANGARQQQIYEALDWPVPIFAHVPLIHGQDGAKLSKRHGALGVEAYRDEGYLSDALANYLLRLGWAHGDEEIISRQRAIEIFDLDGLNKAPARLDVDKLNHVNASYIQDLDDAEFLKLAKPFFKAAGIALESDVADRTRRAAPFVKQRSVTLKQASGAAAFATITRPFDVSGKVAKPLKKDGAKDHLKKLVGLLEGLNDWEDPEAIDAVLQAYAERENVGFGQIGPPLRAALTAGNPAPSLGEVLYSLGKAESLARIGDQIAF